MAATCGNCGASMGIMARISGRPFCDACLDKIGQARGAVQTALADDLLTEDQEDRFNALVTSLGLGPAALEQAVGDQIFELQLGRVNADRLIPVSNPQLMVKPGEIVYLEMAATLMKGVVQREMRGGYRGVSVRIAKGVRFNTGGFRGHSVVIGSHTEVADTGVVSVTSQRIVYAGSRKSLEIPYSKLLGMAGFTDGVRFQVANRATQPLIGVASGPLVVATVNAAMGRVG